MSRYTTIEEFEAEHREANRRWMEAALEQGRKEALAALRTPMPEIVWHTTGELGPDR